MINENTYTCSISLSLSRISKPPMNTRQPIRSLFFTFLFLNSLIELSAAEVCYSSSCLGSKPIIRFPFHLQSLQPNYCGFPGFDLLCGALNQTLIELPNSGSFTVQGIDYAAQSIWLNDPQSCLPKRLLQFNLSGSPFNGFFYQNFTFFNCTFDYRKYKFNPIGCMSGENYTIFASSSQRKISFLASRCGWLATVPVPVEREFSEQVPTSDLGEDIMLTWGWPRCGRCESRGGRCGFRGQNTTQIACRHADRHGLPRSARYAIVAGAGVPAFLCLLGFLCFVCRRLKRFGRRHHPIMDFSSMVAAASQPTTALSGLDDPTIESYPKTILGESRRLPKPDHNICSICLSEYMPKEALRSIPECQHCFHAECIDEWLRLNPSCPVCRNTPDSKPQAS